MPYFEENLRDVLAKLQECQASLILSGDPETAHTVSLAVLELQMKVNRIDDVELKALCDAMVREGEIATEPAQPTPEVLRPRPPVSLKLVK